MGRTNYIHCHCSLNSPSVHLVFCKSMTDTGRAHKITQSSANRLNYYLRTHPEFKVEPVLFPDFVGFCAERTVKNG